MYAMLTLPPGQEFTAPRRAPTLRVRSADDLRNALRQARAQAVTLDGTGMDQVLQVDACRGLVEVQAAARWPDIAAHPALQGVGLERFAGDRVLPGTVGESVARAAPGPDGLPVTAHVAAVTLVMPDGELRRAGRGANGDLLRLVLGGQGVIGVLYSVTLCLDSLRRSAADATAPVELGLEAGAPSRVAPNASCVAAYLLPPEALEDFLADLRARADERRLSLLGVAVRRLLPDSSCHLNWATREWAGVEVCFAIRATLGAAVAAAEVRGELLAAALARGGAFPISDLRDATRAQLDACYPTLPDFLAEKRRSDPGERLQNAWYRQAAARLRASACEVRWDRNG